MDGTPNQTWKGLLGKLATTLKLLVQQLISEVKQQLMQPSISMPEDHETEPAGKTKRNKLVREIQNSFEIPNEYASYGTELDKYFYHKKSNDEVVNFILYEICPRHLKKKATKALKQICWGSELREEVPVGIFFMIPRWRKIRKRESRPS